MCQSKVFTVDDDRQQLLLDEAARLTVDGDQIKVEPLLGTPISLSARIREIDLMGHRIVLEKV